MLDHPGVRLLNQLCLQLNVLYPNSVLLFLSSLISVCICIYIYIYVYIHIHMYIYMYVKSSGTKPCNYQFKNSDKHWNLSFQKVLFLLLEFPFFSWLYNHFITRKVDLVRIKITFRYKYFILVKYLY